MPKLETIKNSFYLDNVDPCIDTRSATYRIKAIGTNVNIAAIKLLDNDIHDTRLMKGFTSCISILPKDNVQHITGVTRVYLVVENNLNDILESTLDNYKYGVDENLQDLYHTPENILMVQDHIWHYSQLGQDPDINARTMIPSSLISKTKSNRRLQKGDNLYLLFITYVTDTDSTTDGHTDAYYAMVNYTTFLDT